MNFHPKIHMIVLGGGLTVKNQWKDNGFEFFLPIQIISKVFKGKYLDELKSLWKGNQLTFHGSAEQYRNFAISNHRIIRMDESTVTFSVKDYCNNGQWKELTLSGVEFIRRLLMHVPVRIRHYGLLCSRSKNKKLTLCRSLLGCKKYLSRLQDKEMPVKLKILYGIKIFVCKSCGGHMVAPIASYL